MWCLVLLTAVGLATEDTDEDNLFLLDLPHSRVVVTGYDVSQPTLVVAENAQRTCSFSVVAHQRAAETVGVSCPPELREAIDTNWQYSFTSPLPSKTDLMTVSFLFPTIGDSTSTVVITPSPQVLGYVFPPGVMTRDNDRSAGVEGGVVGGVVREKGTIRHLDMVEDHLWRSWRRGLPEMQDCYVTRLVKRKDLRGSWKVDFVVTAEGVVQDLKIVGLGIEDAPLVECLASEIEKRVFMNLPRNESFETTITFHH